MNKVKIKKAYKGKFKIAETKKRGLLSLVKKNIIGSLYFYTNGVTFICPTLTYK